jgi:hypothetical protein
MPVSPEKSVIHFEDIELPKFNELGNSQLNRAQVSAYAQESLTTLATHLRSALVIGETTSLPLKVQAPAIARLLYALAEDLENIADL